MLLTRDLSVIRTLALPSNAKNRHSLFAEAKCFALSIRLIFISMRR